MIERPVSQTTLALGAGSGLVFAEEADYPLSAIALNALAGGTSSRFFRAVRDELGASYGISAELPLMAGAARMLVVSTALDNTAAPKALAVIRAGYAAFLADGLGEAEFAASRTRVVNGIEESLRRSASAATLMRDALRQGLSAAEAPRRLEALRTVSREVVNARLRERWPAPPLLTVIVAPSAEGFSADCVVRAGEEPERCLRP